MPRTATVQNIASILGISFTLDKKGELTGIPVNLELNWGTFGTNETIDIFPELNQGQKTAAQAFYDNLKRILEMKVLG